MDTLVYIYKYTVSIISKIIDVNYINLARHNSTHAPTSPSLLNTHEISYPQPTPTLLHHTQDARQSIAAYKFVVNLST